MNSPQNKAIGKDSGFDGVDPDIIRGAKNNDISEVQAALDMDKSQINTQDIAHRMSAAHYAAALGNSSMASFLLQQEGIDLSLTDRWGRDALDVAILAGNQQIIDEMFLHRCGDPTVGDHPDDDPDPGPNNPDVIPFKPK